MNFEKLKRSLGHRVQLQPAACVIDEQGTGSTVQNYDWIVEDITSARAILVCEQTGHRVTLGLDHIHNFATNPQAGDQHGFYVLTVQVFIQGKGAWYEPTRPGQPLKPQEVAVDEKWVDLNYPRDCGLQARLEAEGFKTGWVMDDKLARKIDLEGWTVVIEPDGKGGLVKYRLKDRPADQTYLKKRG